MSSGAVDSRLVALLVIIVLSCRVSGMEAEDLCQQFKSGRATIALLTPTDEKFLLLDDHFRGYLLPKDHFHIAWRITSHIEPPWLNLTAQSPIQVNVGQQTPPPINGRGVFYFTELKHKIVTYLGVLWSNLTTMTIVPIDPPGPAAHYSCQQDDYITARVIPNIFFFRADSLGAIFYRPSFTWDSLIAIKLNIYFVDGTVKVYPSSLNSLSPYNLTSLDGGFIDDRDFYAFSNCAKAIFKFESSKGMNKPKRNALRLADFILCSATDQPAKSYRPEVEIVPAKCYHPEAEPTAIPTLPTTTEDRILLIMLFIIVEIVVPVLCIVCIFYLCCRSKSSPAAGNSRGNSPTTSSLTSPRTKSGGGGDGIKSFGAFWAKRN